MAGTAGIAAAGIAAGANALFGYNRENFLYDRKMRQKQEFKVAAFRNQQAGLWREDIRDLIGLTAGKMETYTIVNALLLVLCIELFAAGRLVPGTPEWLLWLYTSAVTGAFAHLLQALWLAMHASVAAQAGSVRLLTQLVRLPVPSWEQLEAMRTYGSSCEALGFRKLLRVPFVDSLLRGLRGRTSAAGGPQGREETAAADPWDLERRGAGIYELQHRPTQELRHAQLVRRAAAQWQGHEAFARVAMTLGVCQLLYAIMYYCLGQVLVEDGEVWGAFFVGALLASAVASLLGLDLSLLAREAYMVCALVYAGPILASAAALLWCTYTPEGTLLALGLLPMAFGAHGLLYAYVAALAGSEEQPGGAVIPVRWRTVLYVDVFGWLSRSPSRRASQSRWSLRGRNKAGYSPVPRVGDEEYAPAHDAEVCIEQAPPDEDELDKYSDMSSNVEAASDRMLQELRRELDFWRSDEVSRALSAGGRERVWRCTQEFERLAGASTSAGSSSGVAAAGARWYESGVAAAGQQPPLAGPTPLGGLVGSTSCSKDGRPLSLAVTEERLERLRAEIAAACHARNSEGGGPTLAGAEFGGSWSARHRDSARTRVTFKDPDEELLEGVGSRAAVPKVHGRAFEDDSYGPPGAHTPDEEGGAEGRAAPWKTFRGLARLLAGVHFAGALWSVWRFSGHSDIHAKPLPLADEEQFGSEGGGSISLASQLAEGGVHISPQYWEMPDAQLSKLVEGSPLETIWPHSSRFEPRALSCDPQAQRFVVADDFGVYAAQLARQASDPGDALADHRRRQLRARASEAIFQQVPPCRPLEGHAPKDVDILCGDGAGGERCRALVLYASGRGMTLAECPLRGEGEWAAKNWAISVDWLDDLSGEAIESVALGRRCRGPANTSVEVAPGLRGCVLVGTSAGRLVQLRPHVTKRNELVPLWATRPVRSPSRQAVSKTALPLSQGSLHVVPAGYVLILQPPEGGSSGRSAWPGTVLALDMERDLTVGEWELPKDVQWQSLCGGGGDALYMLARRAGLGASLWRFALPLELQRFAPGNSAHDDADSAGVTAF